MTCVLCVAGCDRAPAPAATRASRAPSSQPASDDVLVKVVALRDLIDRQPKAQDQATYAAYLIKDDRGGELAGMLSAGGGEQGPPVVGSLDVYLRKGRTMDRASGRPVKVFHARLVSPPSADGRAEVVASWQAGRLLAETYRYRLRNGGGTWVVVDRTRETQTLPLSD